MFRHLSHRKFRDSIRKECNCTQKCSGTLIAISRSSQIPIPARRGEFKLVHKNATAAPMHTRRSNKNKMGLVKKVQHKEKPKSPIGAIAVAIKRPTHGALRPPPVVRVHPVCAHAGCTGLCVPNKRGGKALCYQSECRKCYTKRRTDNLKRSDAERVPPPPHCGVAVAPAPAPVVPSTPPRPLAPAAVVAPNAPARVERRPTVDWGPVKRHPVRALSQPPLFVTTREYDLRRQLYEQAVVDAKNANKAREACTEAWGGLFFNQSTLTMEARTAMYKAFASHRDAVSGCERRRDALHNAWLRCEIVE